MILLGQIQFASSLATIASVQSRGADIERVQLETTMHHREVDSVDFAEAAEGIGTASEDQPATDRDGDGRRTWDLAGETAESETDVGGTNADDVRSLDPANIRGQYFDVSV